HFLAHQIEALANGTCDVALASPDSTSILLERDNRESLAIMEKVGMLWPPQESGNIHHTITAMALSRWSNNRDDAITLMEHLNSRESQEWLSKIYKEMPIHAMSSKHYRPKEINWYPENKIEVKRVGRLLSKARRMMREAGWH
ncbi:MAG: hypothetical protein HQL50_07965, partial [Magnetococcales bacterium]|nr:hypothetical protein [Magnetococcales bacterium]